MQHNVVLRRRWRSATQVTQSDGEAYTGTGGALPPRTPLVQWGGCAPPAEHAVEVCVCVCVLLLLLLLLNSLNVP